MEICNMVFSCNIQYGKSKNLLNIIHFQKNILYRDKYYCWKHVDSFSISRNPKLWTPNPKQQLFIDPAINRLTTRFNCRY